MHRVDLADKNYITKQLDVSLSSDKAENQNCWFYKAQKAKEDLKGFGVLEIEEAQKPVMLELRGPKFETCAESRSTG